MHGTLADNIEPYTLHRARELSLSLSLRAAARMQACTCVVSLLIPTTSIRAHGGAARRPGRAGPARASVHVSRRPLRSICMPARCVERIFFLYIMLIFLHRGIVHALQVSMLIGCMYNFVNFKI